MTPATRRQIEAVLKKYTRQLKAKKSVSVNEILSLTRLVSAVTRSSGGDPLLEESGDPDFHESLKS